VKELRTLLSLLVLLVFSVGIGAETISHTFPSGNKYVGKVKGRKMHGQDTLKWNCFHSDILPF